MSAAEDQLVHGNKSAITPGSEAAELLGLAQDDFACPICMSMFRDPFVTDCGHSFCFQCITTHLVNKKTCPCCSTYVTADKIHPNFLLHKVVAKVSRANIGRKLTPPELVVQLITEDRAHLKLDDVNKLLHLLGERKRLLEQQDAESNLQLLLHFLRHSRQEKAKQLVGLQSELKLLEADIKQVISRKTMTGAPGAAQPQQAQLTAAAGPANSLQEAPVPSAVPPQSQPATQHAMLQSQGMLPHSVTVQQPAAAPSTTAAISAAATGAELCQPASFLLSGGSQPQAPAASPAQQHLGASRGMAGQSTGQQLTEHSPAPWSLDPGMSRASNGYVMITNAAPPVQQGPSDLNWAASQAAASSAAPLTAPPASQLMANGSMHIHPRHLAFQHFHQQQAALQQRQQQPGNEMLASAMSMESNDGDRLDRAASLVSAQSDAIRTRRRRLLSQFEDLQQCYLRLRAPRKRIPQSPAPTTPSSLAPDQQQPAKRIKQEPSVDGLRHPSDSAHADPLSQAHHSGPSQACVPGPSAGAGLHAQAGTLPHAQRHGAGPLHQHHLSGRQSSPVAATGFQQGTKQESGAHSDLAEARDKSPSAGPQGVNMDKGAQQQQQLGHTQLQQHQQQQQSASVAALDHGAAGQGVVGPADEEGLAEFSRMLSVFTHCARLKVIAQLPRTSNAHCSNILSSIEFDRDGQVFATAGVSKRISMYEYSAVMATPGAEMHTPSQELGTRSKLSCLSWNKYLRTYLASSDYEGVVHIWDVATGQNVVEYEAHEKRIWSVDFCQSDPTLLMSGSDDGMVKIWSSNEPNSVAEIDIKANVCCAKYNPESMYSIAVGAADHTVHTYDLRKADKAVHVFRGHRKAVSYVRYLNGHELVSASTDSTLRLWDTKLCTNTRVFNGHNNEKNFVGLSVFDDFMACGSETNEVFVYYKAMSKPVCRRLFSVPAEMAQHAHNQDASQFISAVSWKPDSQVLLSANSQGTIKVMQVTA